MGMQFEDINSEYQEFIRSQKIFFVATGKSSGKINVSPKGMDTLRIIDAKKVIWLNLTGSGNETAAHLQQDNRMTLMFCAFEGKPLILRLYGRATLYHVGEKGYQSYIDHFPDLPGKRQVIELQIDMVQNSCGYGIPIMEYKEDRKGLRAWAEKKGEDGIRNYWKEKNTLSIDGDPTGMPKL